MLRVGLPGSMVFTARRHRPRVEYTSMNQHVYRPNLPQNPLVRIAAVIVAAFVVIGAIFLGAVVLFFLVGFAILAWLTLSVRLWWLRRQVQSGDSRPESQHGEIVEVEYTVVEERSANNNRDRDRESD